MVAYKSSFYIDGLDRKILKGRHGTILLRPEYEFWRADQKPLYVPEDCRVIFEHSIKLDNGRIENTNTTARSLGRYLPAVVESISAASPRTQFIEIGPGLGELIPAVYYKFARQTSEFTKPIAIDPLNYHAFLEMVEEMQSKDLSDQEYRILEEVQYRANTILNPAKVTLINTTFGKALAQNRQLLGSADVAVDNWGAVSYTSTEFCGPGCVFGRAFRVKCMETRLLKPEGKLFTKGVDAHMLLEHRKTARRK